MHPHTAFAPHSPANKEREIYLFPPNPLIFLSDCICSRETFVINVNHAKLTIPSTPFPPPPSPPHIPLSHTHTLVFLQVFLYFSYFSTIPQITLFFQLIILYFKNFLHVNSSDHPCASTSIPLFFLFFYTSIPQITLVFSLVFLYFSYFSTRQFLRSPLSCRYSIPLFFLIFHKSIPQIPSGSLSLPPPLHPPFHLIPYLPFLFLFLLFCSYFCSLILPIPLFFLSSPSIPPPFFPLVPQSFSSLSSPITFLFLSFLSKPIPSSSFLSPLSYPFTSHL